MFKSLSVQIKKHFKLKNFQFNKQLFLIRRLNLIALKFEINFKI